MNQNISQKINQKTKKTMTQKINQNINRHIKKTILIFFSLLIIINATVITPSLSAQSTPNKDASKEKKNNAEKLVPKPIKPGERKANPEPYNQAAFPDWAYYTYRYGAVAVGVIPFAILFSTMAFDTYKTIDESMITGSFQNQYLPLYFSGPDKPLYESDEVVNILYITLAVSLSVSTIDLAIQLIKKSRGNAISSILRN